MNKRPLPFSERFLSWLVKAEYLEEIIGDLLEYKDEIQEQPRWKRGILYWFHVFNFLQPWALKKFSGSQKLNNYGMFQNYLKTSFRSLKKNALFSFINVIGLAISMSIGILMILMLTEINGFDSFHKNKGHIYRLTSNKVMFGQEMDMSSASHFIGAEIEKKVPGVEHVLILRPGMSANLVTEAGPISITGLYATPSFFDVFSFELVKGNKETALLDPNNIILTETTARKLFGDADPMGKALDLESTGGFQNRTIKGVISGVMPDPPVNSHLRFEALVSHATYDQPATGRGWSRDYKTDPEAFHDSFVYLVLNEETKTEDVEAALPAIMEAYNATQDTPLTHGLQPLDTFITSDKYRNQTGTRFSAQQLNIMLGLTLVVLLSAAFNYTNLSLARALRRSKEVGVRKVAGATKSQIFSQFIVEAVMLSTFALVAGVIMFVFLKPVFLNLPDATARGYAVFTLDFTPLGVLYIVLFALTVGLLAGLLPATFLSKLKTNEVLKGVGKVKLFSGMTLRKGLTVLQFALSIGLIMSAVLMNKQYQFALNYDLGFESENIINIRTRGDYTDLLENDINAMSEVLATSRSIMTMGTGGATLIIAENEDKSQSSILMYNSIDHKYLDMHNYELLAGTGFHKALAEGETNDKIIVNEHLLGVLELGTPDEALGKIIHGRSQDYKIIGVVKDFVNISLNVAGSEILENKSFGFTQHNPGQANMLLAVKFRSEDLAGMMQKLEASFRRFDPVNPFEARLYEEEIAATYKSQKTTFTIISFLAFLAISIATLGLLGMAVFTTETRIKEISIRKVLGAGINRLVMLLSRGFILMIVIAAAIAIPLARYLINDRLLSDFVEKAQFGVFDFLSGFIAVLLIGFLTIGWQILQATRKNPAETLRTE
ncbi:MAG: ABC transporter permease [Roseivirga sp.]